MKKVILRDLELFKSSDVIKVVVSQPLQGSGINADEMRKRCRILDALDKSKNELNLEDADYTLLKNLFSSFQFGSAHPLLLKIIDDVLEAKE